MGMGRQGLLIGEVAARSGVSRKALRLYEAAGILPPPARTATRYRVYGADTLAVLRFVARARWLGFTLAEIKEIVAIKRAGQLPCAHVQALVARKAGELDRTLRELQAQRRMLRGLMVSWGARRGGAAAVCPHIEDGGRPEKRRKKQWRA